MNRLRNTVIFFFLVSIIIGCNPISKSIKINQFESRNKVILRLSRLDSMILGVKFPKKIQIKNNSQSNESFIMIDYLYEDSLTKWRNLGIELYKKEKKGLKRISNNKKKTISSTYNLEYIFYTRHFIDSSKIIQDQLKPYMHRMFSENKDTLHINTVNEFKQKHKELFEKLTKNDSISIQFLNGKELGERITVPVEW